MTRKWAQVRLESDTLGTSDTRHIRERQEVEAGKISLVYRVYGQEKGQTDHADGSKEVKASAQKDEEELCIQRQGCSLGDGIEDLRN